MNEKNNYETGEWNDPRILDSFDSKITNPSIEINGFSIEEKEAFPPNVNPFNYDAYHMGTYVGENCIMYGGNENYIIIVHKKTGKRIRINMPEEK